MHEFSRFNALDNSITWLDDSMERLHMPDSAFDIVSCTCALGYVESIETAIYEIKRVLNPSGLLILTVDVFAQWKERHELLPYRFTKESLWKLLGKCGFTVAWSRLCRCNVGVINYANLRIRRKRSRNAILLRSIVAKTVRSYTHQLLRQGALGELVLVAKNLKR
jgi:SAM-dependent methyltransferase